MYWGDINIVSFNYNSNSNNNNNNNNNSKNNNNNKNTNKKIFVAILFDDIFWHTNGKTNLSKLYGNGSCSSI